METKDPRFGENFEANKKNTLDPYRLEKNNDGETLPEEYKFVDEMRKNFKKALLKSGETNSWPESPKGLTSIEEVFEEAKNEVDKKWKEYVSSVINNKSKEWFKNIPKGKNDDLRKLLSDPEALEDKLSGYQLGALGDIRSLDPESWRMLTLASSERQLALIALLRHWFGLSADKKNVISKDDIKKMGLNKNEIALILEMAALLGKYFDHAFIKQIQYADQPGGSTETPLGETIGASRLYDVYKNSDSDEYDVKTYGEVFPFEWQGIKKHLERMAQKTSKLLEEKELPETYKGLPAYLNQLANVYASEEKDPEKLNDMWEELDKKSLKLSESCCPIIIASQSTPMVAGDANKVDVEIRLGIRTPKTKEYDESIKSYQKIANKFANKYKNKLEDLSAKIPPAISSTQLFAFGANLTWMTPADSRPEVIYFYPNTIIKEGISIYPKLKKIMPSLDIDQETYEKAYVLDTVLHEDSHPIMPEEDDAVLKRIGNNAEAAILEELKAETFGMNTLQEKLKKDPQAEKTTKNQFFAKLGVVCDYLTNKSSDIGSDSERYYYTGIAILDALLEKGILYEEKAGIYNYTNAKEGIKVIAEMGQKILDQFYLDEKSNSKKVTPAIKKLRKQKNNDKIQKFINALKA